MSEREFWQKEAPVDPATDRYGRELDEEKPVIVAKTSENGKMTEKEKADLVLLHSMLQMAGMTIMKGKAESRKDDQKKEAEEKDESAIEEDEVAAPEVSAERQLAFEELTPKRLLKQRTTWPMTLAGIVVIVVLIAYGLHYFLKSVGF